jgi:chromosome segregation ATPase
MKILYIASERSSAQSAATALNGTAPNLRVLWTSQLDRAADRIREDGGLSAVVVEAPPDSPPSAAFLTHLRRLTLAAPVVVVASAQVAGELASLEPGAAEYVARNEWLFRELPPAISRAIARRRARGASSGTPASPGVDQTAKPAEAQTAVSRAEQARASEAAAAAGRQAELEAVIDRQRTRCAGLEDELVRAQAALREAEQRQESAARAAAGELAERQAQYDVAMARVAASWELVDEELRQAAVAVERARKGEEAAVADAERLSRREAELASRVTSVEAALRAASDRAADAAAANEGFKQELARSKQQLVDVEAALEQARQDHAASAAEVDRLHGREGELASMLAEAKTSHVELERRLAGTEAAFNDANDRATRERLAASSRAAQREAELDGLLREERARRADFEQKLAQAESSMREAERRHESAVAAAAAAFADREAQLDAAMAAAATELAERQTRFEARLSELSTARDELDRRAGGLAADLDGARQDLAADKAEIERLTEREAVLTSQLAEASESRDTLACQLSDVRTAMDDAGERASRERLAAAEREAQLAAAIATAATESAEREARFEAQLTELVAVREDLDRRAAGLAADLDSARQDLAADKAEIERLTEREAALTSQLAEAAETREALARQLSDVRTAVDDAEARAGRERLAAAERQTALESRLAGELGRRETAEQEILDLRSSAADAARAFREEAAAMTSRAREEAARIQGDFRQTLQRVSAEHAAALAALSASVAERDLRIDEQRARHDALESRLTAALEELDLARARRDVLQIEADRVPQLQKQLDEIRAEARRQFDEAPLALFKCTRDGTLTHANRAFVNLVGAAPGDPGGPDLARRIFESPDDLSWLIECCLSAGAKDSIETTWRKPGGGRLVVRLSARTSGADAIEITVEDLTILRALQDRLGQAHRMEAVGRLASEVAVTCGNLLRDVHQNAQSWLMTAVADAPARQQGEMLLEEMTRAAGFLRQLAAYGDEETKALAPVDLNKVLCDLQPVLKRVAGDDVKLELPIASAPINVEVKAERVERLLVNLASYSRQRMPFGGRLRVDVARVLADGQFIAQHPNCRLGPHALITVTEIGRDVHARGVLRLRDGTIATNAHRAGPETPGVDLGALQALIDECGGHLWMTVEPRGDMVVKVHLPMRADEEAAADAPVVRGGRGTIARWFQH